MNKKREKLLIPKLRFPEFKKNSKWQFVPLVNILSEHGTKSSGVESVFSVSVHKGLINQIEHLGRSYSAASTLHYKRVLPGDVVYTKSPTGSFPLGIIKQSKLDFPVIVSPLYGVFSPKTIALGSMLDAYFSEPEKAKIFLEPLAQKGAKNTININNDKFLSGKLFLPTNNKEQKKIADILSSLDALIIAEDKKIQILREHKKGLLQKLFPVEGKAAPKLRFPEFKKNHAIAFEHGNIIFKSISNKQHDSNLPLLAITQEYGAIPRNDIDYNVFVTNKSIEGYKVVEVGDFIISLRSFQGGIEYSQFHGICSPAYVVLRNRIPVVNGYYKQYFKSNLFIQQLNKNIEGIRDGKMVSYEQFSNLTLPKPHNKEQQKIADLLSSLDALVIAKDKKIQLLRKHKKGLLQGLFPAVHEVNV